ncbi:hypothetical protein [Nocardioides bruguierae]|uniref:Uncharacterized protein n=1 Tax=Nocardioides bruguierae TaxID=2945102 RepID=A0A9X2IDB4_9ACTN|nr:hypothetical protein [Nocardioides bruguierae]MCM0619566.1 hypothetical protein [Nocardioides bruguierae]
MSRTSDREPRATRPVGSHDRDGRVAAWGVGVALVLVALAFALPHLLGWDVHTRASRSSVDAPLIPPLHGWLEPKLLGPGTLPALALAVLGWTWFGRWARTARWGRLLLVGYLLCLGWCLALALVDGPSGLSRVLGSDVEYLPTARSVTDVGALLGEYVSRIPYAAAPDNWPTHVAGHPPLMLLFFVGLVHLGLGGDLAAGVVVTVVGATLPLAVLVAARALGAERHARAAAPFLVLSPVAVFVAVSADAVIGATMAWGLAALAVAATTRGRGWLPWSVVAGLLLGAGVMMSYGMPLMGLVALAVLATARSWRPLVPAALAALAVVLGFALAGFAWWEAYPVLHDRYWDGIAADRPAAYWLWGNLAALVVITGPLVPGALAVAGARLRAVSPLAGPARDAVRTVVLLSLATALVVLLADASRMSKAETERIWVPFVPWLTLAVALLPGVLEGRGRWLRVGLAVQLAGTILVQQLFYTSW